MLTSVVNRHSGSESVVPGIEVLLSEQLHLIRGKRIGLITNHTGVDRRLRHDIDAFIATPGLGLVALFSPEHGIRGTVQAGEKVRSGVDEKTGIPVYSLYGEETRPTAEMLKEVDVLVYDIQDVGSRFYTYISTLGHCMEAAAGKKIPFIVLDRPNPLGGEAVEGPRLKPEFRSFVGAFPIPIRYGLTPGELAGFIKDTQKLDVALAVVKLKNWRRSQWYDETGLVWVPPSPNIPTLEAALVYPGTCLMEGTNLSEGRGTTKPFKVVGAPWIDGLKLAESLNRTNLPGVLFRATAFTPTFSKFSGEACQGVQLHIVDRRTFRPLLTALAILKEIRSAYPSQFQFTNKHFDRLAGSDELRKSLEQNLAVEKIVAAWDASVKEFEVARMKYLLYP
jgi:uncharacterized protein YbbC (DUF1343 family)